MCCVASCCVAWWKQNLTRQLTCQALSASTATGPELTSDTLASAVGGAYTMMATRFSDFSGLGIGETVILLTSTLQPH